MQNQFVAQASEAQLWCALKLPERVEEYQQLLRSRELLDANNNYNLCQLNEGQCREVVESIVMKRRALLHEIDMATAPDRFAGRFLIYIPNATLSYGGSGSISDEFFDENDCPPHDTWVAYSQKPARVWRGFRGDVNYLVSWVPERLNEVVEKGIYGNTSGGLIWWDEIF